MTRQLPRLIAFALLFLTTWGAGMSHADTLRGRVLEGSTQSPVPDVVVRVGAEWTRTDSLGDYAIEIPVAASFWLELYPPGLGDEVLRQRLDPEDVNPAVVRESFVFDERALDRFPEAEWPVGRPSHGVRRVVPDGPPIDLIELWLERRAVQGPSATDLLSLELPDIIPATIRVGRRDAGSCSGNPILRIEEVDLETYAAGVVTAEIGVFRSLTTGEEGQRDSFRAFAIAARAYALWFWANDPEADYHLDDTACNQRYISGPYPAIIDQAAQETAGGLMVKSDTTTTIDKFEYAASCGRHGSRPEYQDELVADDTGGNACTSGGWCGHNDCAAHEVNPDFADEGRCLVRGICQWGTAERSARGDGYLEILAHYQPNLDVLIAGDVPSTVLVGFVRVGDVETGAAIVGAAVSLDTGEHTVSGADGLFRIEDVASGYRSLTVEAAGYLSQRLDVEVLAGVENWASVAMQPTSGEDVGDPDTDSMADVGPERDGGADVVNPALDVGAPQADTPHLPAPSLTRFEQVGDEGLAEGCAQTRSDPRSPARIVWFTLVLVLLASGRSRPERRTTDR